MKDILYIILWLVVIGLWINNIFLIGTDGIMGWRILGIIFAPLGVILGLV